MSAAEGTPRFLYAEYGHALVIRPSEGEDTEALFERVCADFENHRIEQDCKGNIYIMPPAGGESANQNVKVARYLDAWAEDVGRGEAFDSSVEFIFPDGSKRGPDASWVSFDTLRSLTLDQRRRYLRVVPEFVIEIKSPTDHWSELQAKMREYKRNGVALGWLIDPKKRWIEVYRQDRDAELIIDAEILEADGPVAGFTLKLKRIWQGLDF
jgi:Uma2 family endonuclease